MEISGVTVSHKANGPQYLPGAGDQLLDTHFLRKGTEGKAHQLGDVEDRNPVADTIGFLNLYLAAIKVGLTKGTGYSDRIRSSLLCLTEDVI